MADKNRPLHILKYLWDHTDEEHPAREMQVLTHDEMQRFLIQAKHDGYYEIFLLDLSTGLRRGELMGLQWKELNMTTGELRIERQVSRVNGELKTFPPKTKSLIRTIVLPPSVLRMLKEYQPTTKGSKWIFPSPVKTEDSPRDPHTVYSNAESDKNTFGVYYSSWITNTIAVFLLEPAKNHAKIACFDCFKEREVNTYRGSSNLTSFALVKLWSNFFKELMTCAE